MPRKDGFGPTGQGPMTGRGLGRCKTIKERPIGRSEGRCGSRRMHHKSGFGVGSGFRNEEISTTNLQHSTDIAEFLEARKMMLETQLELINAELENL